MLYIPYFMPPQYVHCAKHHYRPSDSSVHVCVWVCQNWVVRCLDRGAISVLALGAIYHGYAPEMKAVWLIKFYSAYFLLLLAAAC